VGRKRLGGGFEEEEKTKKKIDKEIRKVADRRVNIR